MRNQSLKRQRLRNRRTGVRLSVLARDGRCMASKLVPEVTCGPVGDRFGLEVDELRGGSYRCTEMYDAARCEALCPRHHDWKTAHKRDYLERLAHAH